MVEAEKDRQIVLAALAERGGGSALRGWRKELDPDGSLDTSFLDFCKAASRMKIQVDALKLFGEDSPQSLSLHELAPVQGGLVDKFRKWMDERFGGPTEMFMAFETPESDGMLTRELFEESCIEHGFEASKEDLSEIFNLLDANCIGSIAMEDVSFLDMDEKRREGAIQKARTKRKFAHEHLLTEVYRENRKLSVPTSHRLAPRGWHAPAFDNLPEVIIEKRLNWQRLHDQRCKQAGADFQRQLQSAFGNGVRAWRRGLDPGCKFVLRKTDLARYCRVVNFNCDINSLWKTLDHDSDGCVGLEDVASKAAASLANFWLWVHKSYGGCSLVWDRVMREARPPSTWKSTSSLPYGAFQRALKSMGWQGIKQGAGIALCNALDLYGCGIVARSDLQWVDRWNPPDWLCQEADPQALEDFRAVMKRACGPPLRQWREMDKDNSNEVSWVEFQEACDEVGFTGNRGGVWRYLDKGLNGHIRLQDYDRVGARILLSFKDFVDKNFGSVEYAFKSMDTDGSGSLTFSEMKRACRRMKWKGDVRTLFYCLDIDASGGPGANSLSYNELAFLDTWPMVQNEDGKEDLADEAEDGDNMFSKRLSTDSRYSFLSNASEVAMSSLASPAGRLRRSSSEPFRPSSDAKPKLPALQRFDNYRPAAHDPSWRKSKTFVKSDITAAFRKSNELLRAKTTQLQTEYKELQKQARRHSLSRRRNSGSRHLDQDAEEDTEEQAEAGLEAVDEGDDPLHLGATA